ncbi:SAC3/GANP/Nin1/mts3/eIF-3 p25 family-domain-containing protein [Calycina marina]|uniref:SAC3/GANP/Nin1/mts3/eIF-3 p25 family-domain-containing protein n=1 Tax=Calycina marina TaxID=1763456 RepID=A0A9P7Z6A6_9HELO|nr:SAC3/GANP/Nin1/mts3/eIF-3 p25 family-domain-containing protein [Calycina marina]
MASSWGGQNIPPAPGTGAPGTTQYFQPAPPAYHSVQVRQSFGITQQPPFIPAQFVPPPPAVSIPQPVTAQRPKTEWPASVRRYVQRCFDPKNLDNDIPRAEIEAKLKKAITSASEKEQLHSIDWDSLPLPQEKIRSDRVQATWHQQSVDLRLGGNGNGNTTLSQAAKKRKSKEMGDHEESNPPWRAANNQNGIESRITYQPLDKRQQQSKEDTTKASSKFQKNLEKRQKRFDGGYKSTYRSPSPDAAAGPVVGTCPTLFKQYFRLTSAPNPANVRPEHILTQTLELLKNKWRKGANYAYICDQFKSMRQDLTVQRITNDFTVAVYETHARIALVNGDLGEYNQCQTQLRVLYAKGLDGKSLEFKAYRILYFILTSNRTSLNDLLADLTIAEKKEAPIRHALDVRSSLALGNYHKFFRLYLNTPHLGAYLMDMFVIRERLAALCNICKAYKPSVKLRFVTEELGFESDADAAQFICDHNGQHLIEERDDGVHFVTGIPAAQLFEASKNAIGKPNGQP